MNPRNIEETLTKIVEIDMDAAKLEAQIQNMSVDNEKLLHRRMRDIEFTHMKQARREGNKMYKDMLERAQAEEAAIVDAGARECAWLDSLLEQQKDVLSKRLFAKLLALKDM